jgi:hypothetical protein
VVYSQAGGGRLAGVERVGGVEVIRVGRVPRQQVLRVEQRLQGEVSRHLAKRESYSVFLIRTAEGISTILPQIVLQRTVAPDF